MTLARHWRPKDGSDRLVCELCPRLCELGPDQRGLCFVRRHADGAIVLDTWGRSSGFCLDPIEKKPLNHFLPGTAVLSYGTAGCNLACKFCQNHDISRSRATDRLAHPATPEAIARAARASGAASVACTYNDPVIFLEYAIDVAEAVRAAGLRSVAVTAGYILPAPRAEFFAAMDAANIDLKAFSEEFYWRQTGAHLAPVLETIEHVVTRTACLVELTTLLIPGLNDSPAEIEAMCRWILDRLGPEVPLHFTAFHPAHRLQDRPATPPATLLAARDRARAAGLHHVYVGNIHHKAAQSSYCQGCGARVIGRDWHALSDWALSADGHCLGCGTRFPGLIEGPPGTWGRQRRAVRIGAP